MSKLFLGKINLSKIDKTKLFDGKTGKWMDVTIWINDKPDEYGNDLSIEQSTKKGDSKLFIGNAKEYVKKEELPDKQGEWRSGEKREVGPKDNQGEWQGKKEVKAMSDVSELPGNVDDGNIPDDDQMSNLPF